MDEHRKRVGERAIKRREELGMTQEGLAAAAGTSVKTVSRFENGRHEGRLDTVNKIAKALDMDRAELIGQPPSPMGLGDDDGTQLDRIEAMLAELLRRTTPSESPGEAAEKAAERIEATPASPAQAPERTRRSRRAA